MTAYVVAVIKVPDYSAADVKGEIHRGGIGGTGENDGRSLGKKAARALSKLLNGAVSGVTPANLWMTVLDAAGTRPTGNVACTRANAAGNYVRFTYGAKTITLTEGVDFARGASDTTCALALSTAINAHAVLKALVTAAPTAGDCAITAKLPTALTQDIALSTDDGTAFAFTQLTGGTEGAAQFFLQHFKLGGPTP